MDRRLMTYILTMSIAALFDASLPAAESYVSAKIRFTSTSKVNEIEMAIVANCSLVGRTSKGEAVFDIGEDSPSDVCLRLSRFGSVSITRGMPHDFEPIREIVIGLSGSVITADGIKEISPQISLMASSQDHVVIGIAPSEKAWKVELLRSLKTVGEYIEPNYQYHLVTPITSACPPCNQYCTTFPNDLLFPQQWGAQKIQLPSVWSGVATTDVVVAVIDTGVDILHPELASNIWTNRGEIPANNIDDDLNGYIDDVYGYNFFAMNPDVTTNSCAGQACFHGTHCAGTIGAVGNNGAGIAGVNWQIRIMPISIFNNGTEGATEHSISLAIRYAADNGARIINNSWGGGARSELIERAIAYCDQKQVLFVTAAGNYYGTNVDEIPFYPGSYANPNILNVLASGYSDEAIALSNIGATSVDLAAPGTDILSLGLNGSLSYSSGTSMAAPFVSGAAALFWGMPSHTNMSVADVKTALMTHVAPSSALSGKCVTGGRLDASFIYSPFSQYASNKFTQICLSNCEHQEKCNGCLPRNREHRSSLFRIRRRN